MCNKKKPALSALIIQISQLWDSKKRTENQVGYVRLVWHMGIWSSYQVDFHKNEKTKCNIQEVQA